MKHRGESTSDLVASLGMHASPMPRNFASDPPIGDLAFQIPPVDNQLVSMKIVTPAAGTLLLSRDVAEQRPIFNLAKVRPLLKETPNPHIVKRLVLSGWPWKDY